MTPERAARASAELAIVELAPFARAALRRERITRLAIGISFLVAGLVGIVVLAAAAPLAELATIGAIFFFVAIVPGVVFVAWGAPGIDRHPLVVALEQRPGSIRSVHHAYMEQIGGYTKLATITLADGTAHTIPIR